jgi:biofilm PGA synthesis N-glycosyltransferase PgaC
MTTHHAIESAGPQAETVPDLKYVLVTPARNEATFIEQTIQSVVAQTVRPVKWIIVSDGSTDATEDIVNAYASAHPWIELLRMPERTERDFAGKVYAFNAGYGRVKELDYEVIASLDGDISFEPDYLAFLLGKFRDNPRLGVAGTPFREGTHQYDYRFTSIEHVSGACQVFRRDCFEEIGGYVPRKMGGIDLVAVITARMKGWQTRSFPEKTCIHHRKMGTAKQNLWSAAFRGGYGDYRLGTHPLWEFCRSPYQLSQRPLIAGACLRLAGFVWAMATRTDKQVPADLVAFRRQEQMKRLRHFVAGPFRSDGHA